MKAYRAKSTLTSFPKPYTQIETGTMMYIRGQCDEGLQLMKLPDNAAEILKCVDENSDQQSCSLHAIMDQLDDETNLACQIFINNNKARELYHQGRLEDGLETLSESLEILRYHPSLSEKVQFLDYVAILLRNMGHIAFVQGHFEESFVYVMEVLQLGENAHDWYNLGQLLWRLDRGLDEAESALTRSIQILIETKEDSTPCSIAKNIKRDLVTVQTLLLIVQAQRSGSTRGDVVSLLQLLVKQRATHGYEHESVSMTLCSLGSLYWSMGRTQIASRFLSEAIRVQQQICAPETEILITLARLGQALYDDCQDVEAMSCFREALRMKGTMLGGESDQVKAICAKVLYNIGMIQSRQGGSGNHHQRQRALHSFRLCFDLRKEVLGVDHPAVASALHNIAILLLEDGQVSDSMKSFEESLRIRKLVLGSAHLEVATSMRHIGRLLHDRGDYQLAIKNYSDALVILRNSKSRQTHHLVEVLEGLGNAQHSSGLLEQALQSYKKAASLLQRQLGSKAKKSPIKDIIRVFNVMGNLSLDMADMEAAKKFFREAARLSGRKQSFLEKRSAPCAGAA
jgi:tetratricopeptide (TPR) repeat protein